MLSTLIQFTKTPPSSSSSKSSLTKLSNRDEYSTWRDLCPILTGTMMPSYKHLVIATPLGHYIFRTDLDQEENCDLYAITCQSIGKAIMGSIVIGEPELSYTANEMLLWKRLHSQLLKKDMDYLAQKKILTELEDMSKNSKKIQTAFLVRFLKVLTWLCEVF